MHRFATLGLLLCVIFLALGAGFGMGRIGLLSSAEDQLQISPVPDTRADQAVVRIDGIYNGQLTGQTHGDVQFFLRDTVVPLDASGAFHIPAGTTFIDTITIVIPDGMHFVASKQGTRYYPIPSANGDRILPQNRIYFKTEAEAKAAGYK